MSGPLRSSFWSRVWSVNIRTKILGIVTVCILLFASVLVWHAYQDVSGALRDGLKQRGITIGTSLASQSRDLILTDNLFPLYRLARDTRDADRDIAYIFVLGPSGHVLVHTFDGGFPTSLLGVNKANSGEPYRAKLLEADGERIQDLAIPVLGGKAGTVRLGMSESTIDVEMAGHVRHIFFWVIVITSLGLFVAYGLASILTEPLSRLAAAARAIGRGDFKWHRPVWARDEIGALGAAFDEMSEELRRKEETRVQLLAKIIGAQEEERKRMARELHDETSQALTSLMVGLRFIEDASQTVQVGNKAAELRALGAQILNEVHHLATELRPSILDDLGLVAAIQRYTRDYSNKMGIKVDTDVSGLAGRRLPPEVDVAVYRIIQEALTNTAKHAEARNVSVVLGYRDSSMIAVIEDDGRGFDVDAIMASPDGDKLGLFGMSERALLIGGALTIESQPGEGTAVFLEVPLKPSQVVSDE